MEKVIVKYGPGNTLEFTPPSGSTIRDLIQSTQVKAALNLPENVRALIRGVEQDPSTRVCCGDVIVFEQVAAKKG